MFGSFVTYIWVICNIHLDVLCNIHLGNVTVTYIWVIAWLVSTNKLCSSHILISHIFLPVKSCLSCKMYWTPDTCDEDNAYFNVASQALLIQKSCKRKWLLSSVWVTKLTASWLIWYPFWEMLYRLDLGEPFAAYSLTEELITALHSAHCITFFKYDMFEFHILFCIA